METAMVIKFKIQGIKKPKVRLGKILGKHVMYHEQTRMFQMDYFGYIQSGDIIENWKTSTLHRIMIKKSNRKLPGYDAILSVEDDLRQSEAYIVLD